MPLRSSQRGNAPRITEREVAAELAAELTRYMEQGGMPFERATVETGAGSGYPDITIWLDHASRQAFAFIELKRPGLSEDLSRLPAKAHALGVRHVVVWNFQHGELYEVEGHRLEPRRSYSQPLLNSLEEWRDPGKRAAVVVQARRIVDDLARLARGEVLVAPDKHYFIQILRRAIHQLHPVLQGHLVKAKRNRNVRTTIDTWAVKQGYPLGLTGLDGLLARHWAYSLAVRILFYFAVRRYYPGLPDLQPMAGTPGTLVRALQEAFSRARSVDWQAVFENSPLDDLGLPTEVEPILRQLLEDFHRFDFGQLKEDVVGQIMEGLIPEEERHALGQYFTPEDPVDLILGFVADREDAHYLDPTCGTGVFLSRLYSRLRWLSGYRAGHSQLLSRIWGVDIAHFPAELATVNLFRQDVKDTANFPRVVVSDFFAVRPGQSFSFPPPRAGGNHDRVEVKLPQFHGIVGNFPYIRQELIERQVSGYKREIVKAVAREWFWKDGGLFKKKGITDGEIRQAVQRPPADRDRWLEDQVEGGRVDLQLSGQADIYAYLFYHAAAFLEEGGRMGIITSNSWLDAAYGLELKRFFLRHFKVVAVLASWVEPWFEDAAVNTVITILERCESEEERRKNAVRFVKLKKPLSQLLPQDLHLQEAERWEKVDALVREMEGAAALDVPGGELRAVEKEAYRIRLVPQEVLEAELEARSTAAKWGTYLRMPQVYFDLLQAARDKLVPLERVGRVRRGYTTGINDFFYLEVLDEPAQAPGAVRVRNARGWVGEVEEACLAPVIKSPREARGLVVDPAGLPYRLFLPPVAHAPDPEEMLRKRYPLAYQYVKWGEEQKTESGQLWKEVPSVRGRRAWWLLPPRVPGPILMPMTTGERFAVLRNPGVQADHRLFELLVPESQADLVAGLMNSTLFALFWEAGSRVNLGGGALETEGKDWKEIPIPAPQSLDQRARRAIVGAYATLKNRPVRSIFEELRQRDRQALDRTVLEALGLDPRDYLPRLYEALEELVGERVNLPRMRRVRRRQEKRLSFAQVVEQVRREVLPNRLKPIAAFLPPGTQMVAVSLSGRPVAYQPFFHQTLLHGGDGNQVGELEGREGLGRYAIYAARDGEYRVEVPAHEGVAKETVRRYEDYLREVGSTLVEKALEVTGDYAQAERAALEILRSLDLPELGVRVALPEARG